MRTTDGKRRSYPTVPADASPREGTRPTRLQPVATLDFSGFDALNSARPAPPAPVQQQAEPGTVLLAAPPTATTEPTIAAPPVRPTRPRRPARPAEPDLLTLDAASDDPFDDFSLPDISGADRPVANDDPFADFDDELDEDYPPVAPLRRQRAVRPRSGLVAFGRKVLGFDRPDRKPRQGRPLRGGEDDPAWLAGLDEQVPQTNNGSGKPQRRPRPDFGAELLVPRRPRSGTTPTFDDDIEVTAAPRGFTAGLWLWVARVAVALVFLAGVNQVFVKPFRTTKPAVVVGSLDVAGSQQMAARYVSDYLSFLPGRGPAQLATLQNDVVGSAGAALTQWAGSGYLRVDSVLPGQVTSIDAAHSVVSVAALIHTAMPTPKQVQSNASSTAAAAKLPGADPGLVPAGWTDLGSQWAQLTVPVQADGATVRVSSEGAAFVGEAPQLVSGPIGAQVDQGVSTGTQGVGSSLLTAYASSDLAYLAAPGVLLDGLHGAVTFVSLTGWSVSLPVGGSTTSGTGTGLVTWQLTGTDLRISQPYAVALTNSQGRWYGAALSPNQAAQ